MISRRHRAFVIAAIGLYSLYVIGSALLIARNGLGTAQQHGQEIERDLHETA